MSRVITGKIRRLLGIATAVTAVACSHPYRTITLDGSPRLPDAQGIVSSVSLTSLRIAHGPQLRIDSRLLSFSAANLAPVPVLGRLHQYVQIGVHRHAVVWIASFGTVVRAPGRAPAVYFFGRAVRLGKPRNLVFDNGVVLHVRRGVVVGHLPAPVRAEIDPDAGDVRSLAT